ncbi:hypothetical protein AGLY_013386 [Aphis glycines]|uniref:Uncharacterized protein n=1 Tax=Aphis glycines TaxID=307491 RepID=A0A6G0T657_APHGL|nr:hypothetical protein AGLY_013386 [Aphis glycines]
MNSLETQKQFHDNYLYKIPKITKLFCDRIIRVVGNAGYNKCQTFVSAKLNKNQTTTINHCLPLYTCITRTRLVAPYTSMTALIGPSLYGMVLESGTTNSPLMMKCITAMFWPQGKYNTPTLLPTSVGRISILSLRDDLRMLVGNVPRDPKVVGEIVGVVPGLVFGQCAYPRLAHRLVGHHVRYGALRQQMAAALQRVRIELRQAQPYVSGPAVLAALDLDEEHLARRQRPFAEHYGVGEAHLPVGHRVLVVQAQVVTVEPVKPRLLISARLLLGHGSGTWSISTRASFRGRWRSSSEQTPAAAAAPPLPHPRQRRRPSAAAAVVGTLTPSHLAGLAICGAL